MKSAFLLKILLSLLNVMFLTTTQAQVITGCVYDENQNPVDLLNIVYLNISDSTFIDGVFSIEHCFVSTAPHKEPFILQITRLGFLPVFFRFDTLTIDTLHLKEIRMVTDTNVLQEVNIVATKPLVEMKMGGLTVNLAGTKLENMQTMQDVMKFAPSIVVSDDGNITVVGKGSPLILVDGKEFYGGNPLHFISPKDVYSIEIVKNPGAQYASNVYSVVNIITKKKTDPGWGGWVYSRILQSKNTSNNFQFALNQRTSKFSNMLLCRYHHKRAEVIEDVRTTIIENSNTDFENVTSMNTYNNTPSLEINYNAGYTPTKKQTVGLRYVGNFSQTTGNGSLNSTFGEFSMIGGNSINNQRSSHSMHAHYVYIPDSVSKLMFIADYSMADNSSHSENREQFDHATILKQFGNQIKYDIASIKTDYSTTFGTDFLNFSIGGRYAATENNNQGWFSQNEIEIPHLNQTNVLTENLANGYIQLSKKFGRLSVQIGLQTELNCWQLAQNGTLAIDSTLVQSFPSSVLLFSPTEDIDFRLGYSRRIARPGFQTTARSLMYLNDFLYRESNPFLKPTIMDVFGLEITAGDDIYLNVELVNHKDYMALGLYDSSNVVIIRENNINATQFQTDFNIGKKNKLFATNLSCYVTKFFFEYSFQGKNIESDWGYLFTLNNRFFLKKELELSFSASYEDIGKQGYYETHKNYWVEFGVTKFFLNKDLSLSFLVRNFNTEQYTGQFNKVVFDNIIKDESPYFRFAVFYKFNRIKNNANIDISSQNEERSRM